MEGRRVLLMVTVALFLLAVYGAVAFGCRTWMQYRRTGDSGWRGFRRSGRAEWWAGVLFVLALAVTVAGPLVSLAGLDPVIDHPPVGVVGVVVAAVGIAATFAAQVSMGQSWRIGVDADERTDLVTNGAFALVRNPIFSAMGLAGLGLVLVVPNIVAIAGFVILLVALQLQVRVVEEPYLARVHGGAWDAYAARVGRFTPLATRR